MSKVKRIKKLASKAMAVFFAITIITIGFSSIATPSAFAGSNTKPVITLDPNSWTIANFVINTNHHTTESLAKSGLTASDAEDGPIDASQIQVSGLGSVDENTPGTYILTMTVTDSNGSTSDPFIREINYRSSQSDRTPGRCYENEDYSDIYTIECAQPPVCGDDLLASNEECDDGNLIDGDGCSSQCKIEQTPVYQCNDNSDNDNDGLIDSQDPGCHSDYDANNSNSYTPDKDSEFNTTTCSVQPTGILKLAYLDSVKIFEKTGSVNTYTFSGTDNALKNDINENASEYDFTDNTSGEYYDVFISDAQGNLDLNGGYITIDCYRDSNSQNTATANNIDAVKVELNASSSVASIYADVVSKVELGTGLSGQYATSQGFAQNAVGIEDDNITYLGDQHSSITLGFCQQLPENQKPVIDVLGDNPMQLTVGDTFTDPGATATDTEDGDITSNIVVGGDTVDTSTVGSYTITYDVQDSQGMAADQKTRTVNVSQGTPPPPGPPVIPPPPINPPYFPPTMVITDEKVECSTSGTAIITWKTSLPATNLVFYGKKSHYSPYSLTTFNDNYGYASSTQETSTSTKEHTEIIGGIEQGKWYYFRPIAEQKVGKEVKCIYTKETPSPVCGNGVVEGNEECDDNNTNNNDGCSDKCKIEQTQPTTCNYLLEYLKMGQANNPKEVIKLQKFLKNYEGFSSLDVNGVFGQKTFDAVKAFQTRYKKDVLTPWNLDHPTGYVYYTTKKKINEIYCQREFPLSSLQIKEIQAYKQRIAEIQKQKQQGIDTTKQEKQLPEVGLAPKQQKETKQIALLPKKQTKQGTQTTNVTTTPNQKETGDTLSIYVDKQGKIRANDLTRNATSGGNFNKKIMAMAGLGNFTKFGISYISLQLLSLLALIFAIILFHSQKKKKIVANF